jgi:hypothetical protein
MLVYDLVESAALDRADDINVACHVYDGWLVEVVPFQFRSWRRGRSVQVPVAIEPSDMLPQEMCVVAVPLKLAPIVTVRAT